MTGDEMVYPEHDHDAIMGSIPDHEFADCTTPGYCCYGYDSAFGYRLDFRRMADVAASGG